MKDVWAWTADSGEYKALVDGGGGVAVERAHVTGVVWFELAYVDKKLT